MDHLAVFVATFFMVSITPGMCMTMALSLGISVGFRRSLHMMWGELIGVGLVAGTAAAGVAALALQFPHIFRLAQWLGGGYIIWLGIKLWRSRGAMAVRLDGELVQQESSLGLAWRGFVTAIANPKGWAFFISLLPPFINQQQNLVGQLFQLLGIILCIEWICLMIYAGGGKILRNLLLDAGKVQLLNRISGGLMMLVGVWLILN